MKKSVISLLLFCLGIYTFADVYSIKSVSGNVTYEDKKGHSVDVTSGMKLDSDVKISTGLNSSLVVVLDGKEYSVKPMKKGRLSELVSSSAMKTGVKIGSKVTKKDIAVAAEKTGKGVATASSRASEAKADVLWEE